MGVIRHRAIVPLLLIAGACGALAQEGSPRFTHLTIEDGLSQNTVRALLQDERGFLWVGTKDGLNRYDGYGFVVFRHDPFDERTLSSGYVTALLEDRAGRLWVGTNAGGLNLLDTATGVVSRFAQQVGQQVTALAEDAAGDLWIGTGGAGLYRLRVATIGSPEAVFERFIHAPDDARSLSDDRVTSVLVDQSGALWVGTDNGLNRLDESGRGFDRLGITDGLAHRWVSTIAETADGTLWLGTPLGLSRLVDADSGRFVSYAYPSRSRAYGWSRVLAIAEVSPGQLWLASPEGLIRFDLSTSSYSVLRHDTHDPHSLSGNAVNALLRDRTGVLWAGTNGFGISRYDAKTARFETIRHTPDPSSILDGFSVRAVFEDADGSVWISAGALYRLDRRTGAMHSFESAPDRPEDFGNSGVWSITQDRRGTLWFGSFEGLYSYDPQTGRSRRYAHDPQRSDGLPAKIVYGVFEDSRGAVWAVTRHHLTRLEDQKAGRFISYVHTPHEPTGTGEELFPSAYEDASGYFWLATGTGLVRFDPRNGDVRRFRTDPSDPASLSLDQVRAIAPDPLEPERYLWIGTAGGGLNRLDLRDETFSHVTEHDGLPNNVVYGVLPDGQGRLWLSTNRGLARYDVRSGEIKSYDRRDGLQSSEFNSGALFRNSHGRLYFGGIHGVNSFDPEDFVDNPHVPAIVLTGLRIGDRAVAAGDGSGLLDRAIWDAAALRLSHRETMVTFEFAALDFSVPEKNRYAYRLHGFDYDWVEAGTARSATYTRLPPGSYTFQVRGSNNDGVWNLEGASVRVVVLPPWWRTWWAYALYAGLFGGLLLGIRRYEMRRIHLEHRLDQASERALQLRELDWAKSRFFANVSHEFRTPLTLTLGPLDDIQSGIYGPLDGPMAAQVDLARRSAGRVLDLINQILDVARLESGRTTLHARPLDVGAFVDVVAQPFREMAARKAMTFEVALPATPVEVFADPTQLEKAVANLLSNALKFTPEGGTVRVTVTSEDDAARVAVRDSGPGIPSADLPHVFDRFYQVNEATQTQLGTGIGLALAKEVVDLHGGTLAVESQAGFGSTFTLTLPLGRAHLAPDQVDETAGPWAPGVSSTPLLAAPGGDGVSAAEQVVEHSDDQTTVLVVEDHPEVRAYIRRHLEPAYHVLEAADGEAALALARTLLPDLVLSDVMMPKLDGLGLCRALRADPETDFIPVILLTAKAAPEDRLEGLAEHCDDYLTKPFDVAELRARIDNLIAMRKRLRERFRQAGADGDTMAPSPLRLPAPADITSADDVFLKRVAEAVEANLGDEAFSVERLAEAVGVSRSQLHRQLRALAGQAPSDLIRTLRLERAAHLLAARAGTVSEIAYAVGFKSVGHFSDRFVDVYGCRPSSYATGERTAGDETAS
jgi:signal transduction histidine kinase/ligand-binding sensor domain-containing protein/DNA-binding response OmpR family regulator